MPAVLAALALSVAAPVLVAPAAAEPRSTGDQTVGSTPLDIVWMSNQADSACAKRPIWTIAVQGKALLLRTRNFDYQSVPIAPRGDGSASMDRVLQPARNLKYRVSGSFDGHGTLRLLLEDLAREAEPCSWRFEAKYADGVAPGVSATRSRKP